MKIHKVHKVKQTMKSFINGFEGNDIRIKYTFINGRLHPLLKRRLESIIKQCKAIEDE